MTLRQTLRRVRTPTVLAVIVVVAGAWMALVASHDPGGPFGESAAAWAQAIMSVGAILAAVVIDQGASRRDRQHRLEPSPPPPAQLLLPSPPPSRHQYR